MGVQGTGNLFHEFRSQADEVKWIRDGSQDNDYKVSCLKNQTKPEYFEYCGHEQWAPLNSAAKF